MSVLVDSGLFIAIQNERDAGHAAAKRAMATVLSDRLGRAYTSDHVFDEAVTFTRMRTRSQPEAMKVADRILGVAPYPKVFEILMATGPVFRDAVRILREYGDKTLSFTDATSIALVRRRRIHRILSFDRDFDGIVERMDPRDATADDGAAR